MAERIRHQLYLSRPVSDRLEQLAARPGVCKSAILADAVVAWLDRRGASELDDRFGMRLDRISAALARLERNDHVLLETLALFVRYELAVQPPLAENDAAGRARAAKRFDAFVIQVGRQVATGKASIAADRDGAK
ncbi:CopG family transcriptional regulator [Sphingomonas sp.]|uniref:CopG family transcriptional regulator n=1 Tax=Sphingomonas sp. TaxID=28214 RepID=UPI0025DAB9C2|nr:CopG family transcriptional regulator [Sphingomonas sp.]